MPPNAVMTLALKSTLWNGRVIAARFRWKQWPLTQLFNGSSTTVFPSPVFDLIWQSGGHKFSIECCELLGIYRHCLNHLSVSFSVTLIWIPGHNNIPLNFIVHELARAGTLLLESSSIDLGVSFTFLAKLSLINAPLDTLCFHVQHDFLW